MRSVNEMVHKLQSSVGDIQVEGVNLTPMPGFSLNTNRDMVIRYGVWHGHSNN